MKNKTTSTLLTAVSLMTVLIMASCHKNPYPGIPSGSWITDKANGIVLFLHVDDSTCSPMKISVWSYNRETKEAKRIVTSSGDDFAVWCKSDTIKSYWPKDSIASIYSAKIVSWPDRPLQIVVDGRPDGRNVWSYIVSEKSDTAILLPTNDGFLTCTAHEDLLVALSYDYYGQGSRYSVIKVFDKEGNLLQQIPINKEVNIPFDLCRAIEYDYDITYADLQKLILDNPQLSTEQLIELAKKTFKPRQK